jgi:hypothetical protein
MGRVQIGECLTYLTLERSREGGQEVRSMLNPPKPRKGCLTIHKRCNLDESPNFPACWKTSHEPLEGPTKTDTR